MKRQDDPWARLASAARKEAKPEAPVELPFGFETRLMAQTWEPVAVALFWGPLLRGAMVCSAAMLLFSVALTYRSVQMESPNELAIADNVLRVSLSQ